MLTNVRYLVDSSAITRLTDPHVASVFGPLLDAGVVATCGAVELELLGRIAGADDRTEIRATRAAAFRWLPTTDDEFRRALEVQALLADDGPTASWAALVVAAVAERHQVNVLHDNAVFTRIAEVTGQDVQHIAEDSVP